MEAQARSEGQLEAIPFRLVFDHASDAILSIDLDSQLIVAANPRAEVLSGFQATDLVGAAASILRPEETGETGETGGTGETGEPFGARVYGREGLHEDVRIRRVDGYFVLATVTVGHVRHVSRRLAVCIVRDETERRSLERDLIAKHLALLSTHSELAARVSELRALSEALERRNRELTSVSARMATVSKRAMLGELAAEVAHSMNNPLAALQSTLRTATRVLVRLPDDPRRTQLSALVQRCADAATRLSRSVDGLRQACRSGAAHESCSPVVLVTEIREAIGLFAHRIGEGVRIEVVGDAAATVLASPDDIHHLVGTLVENALHAIGERGVVRIGVESEPDGVRLSVLDSGPGIPEEIRERVFDPFFTTKPPGEGTGLGLSMAKRIVSRYGRSIEVEGKGPLGGAAVHVRFRKEGNR